MANAGTPDLTDVMRELRQIHGKLEVALDRTVNQEKKISEIDTRVHQHGLDIASTKGQATVLGTIASAVMVGLIEGAKSVFGGHTGT